MTRHRAKGAKTEKLLFPDRYLIEADGDDEQEADPAEAQIAQRKEAPYDKAGDLGDDPND